MSDDATKRKKYELHVAYCGEEPKKLSLVWGAPRVVTIISTIDFILSNTPIQVIHVYVTEDILVGISELIPGIIYHLYEPGSLVGLDQLPKPGELAIVDMLSGKPDPFLGQLIKSIDLTPQDEDAFRTVLIVSNDPEERATLTAQVVALTERDSHMTLH